MLRHLLIALFVTGCAPHVRATEWTQFRGPGGSGVAESTELPAQWDENSGVDWKIPLPGFGASSPIVIGDRIYLTCYSGYGLDEEDPGDESALTRHVVCLDFRTGEVIWDKAFPSMAEERPYQGFQALHGFASSTPVTDGQSLYVFFGASGVLALSLDGELLWQTSVGEDTHSWGSATSPVLFENLVIVNASVEDESLVALDKVTGDVVWKSSEKVKRAWNTPLLVNVPGGGTELVVNTKTGLLAFDPGSGEQLWWCEGFDDYICPSVIAHEGVVFAIGARRNTAMAVRVGGRGDVTESHRLWTTPKKGSNVSSPVYHAGHLYWVHETKGIAFCLNAATGEVVYEQRLEPRPGRVYASAVLADGKWYVVTREKGVYVLAAGPSFELLAHNKPLDDSIFNASPAVVDGKLLLRSDRYLYCIGQQK